MTGSEASCIYRGTVRHRRRGPRANEFTYSLFLMYLDLDELPDVLGKYWLWSSKGPAVAQFRREDHMEPHDVSLKEAVLDLVEDRTGHRPGGPVRLLTHLRYFGFVMNPVSFYYCFDASGDHVEAVVAEVNNTPWGERHIYVLEKPTLRSGGARGGLRHEKEFHVSPFMDMNMDYRWHLREPGDSLSVHIDNLRDEKVIFDVTMNLKRRPINSRNLAATLMRHPLMTGKVMAAIYWQALKLWWKGIPFVPHPGNTVQTPTAA